MRNNPVKTFLLLTIIIFIFTPSIQAQSSTTTAATREQEIDIKYSFGKLRPTVKITREKIGEENYKRFPKLIESINALENSMNHFNFKDYIRSKNKFLEAEKAYRSELNKHKKLIGELNLIKSIDGGDVYKAAEQELGDERWVDLMSDALDEIKPEYRKFKNNQATISNEEFYKEVGRIYQLFKVNFNKIKMEREAVGKLLDKEKREIKESIKQSRADINSVRETIGEENYKRFPKLLEAMNAFEKGMNEFDFIFVDKSKTELKKLDTAYQSEFVKQKEILAKLSLIKVSVLEVEERKKALQPSLSSLESFEQINKALNVVKPEYEELQEKQTTISNEEFYKEIERIYEVLRVKANKKQVTTAEKQTTDVATPEQEKEAKTNFKQTKEFIKAYLAKIGQENYKRFPTLIEAFNKLEDGINEFDYQNYQKSLSEYRKRHAVVKSEIEKNEVDISMLANINSIPQKAKDLIKYAEENFRNDKELIDKFSRVSTEILNEYENFKEIENTLNNEEFFKELDRITKFIEGKEKEL